jgi:hypothetical protein
MVGGVLKKLQQSVCGVWAETAVQGLLAFG